MNSKLQTQRGVRLHAVIVLAGAFVLSACASTPPAPTAALQTAQQAISTAEREDAGRYAPGELSEARTKLASAMTAVAQQKMVVAGRLAEQSGVSAELASAKTGAVRAKTVNDEMKRSTVTLIEEMQRGSADKSGDKQ